MLPKTFPFIYRKQINFHKTPISLHPPTSIVRNGVEISFQYSFNHPPDASPLLSLNLIVDSNWKSQQKLHCKQKLISKISLSHSQRVSAPPSPPFHRRLHHFKWLLTVIKRNCNNMDLISTGNKQRFEQTANHQSEMKNWSRLSVVRRPCIS